MVSCAKYLLPLATTPKYSAGLLLLRFRFAFFAIVLFEEGVVDIVERFLEFLEENIIECCSPCWYINGVLGEDTENVDGSANDDDDGRISTSALTIVFTVRAVIALPLSDVYVIFFN
jgi:hypothetical protein